jgi:cell wall assembly regulator SMI1
MIKIEQLLQRWERWIAENLPAAIDTLRPGASDEAITEFEREVVFDLPDDVRAWFRWRDGQTRYCALNVLFGPELLSLEAALSEWKMWHDFADMNEQIAESCTSRPAGAVIAAYTIPG